LTSDQPKGKKKLRGMPCSAESCREKQGADCQTLPLLIHQEQNTSRIFLSIKLDAE